MHAAPVWLAGSSIVEKTVARGAALRSALLQRAIELEAAGDMPSVPNEQLEKPFWESNLRPMVEGLLQCSVARTNRRNPLVTSRDHRAFAVTGNEV